MFNQMYVYIYIYAELTEGLNLHSIRDRQWVILPCSAKTGDGLKVSNIYILTRYIRDIYFYIILYRKDLILLYMNLHM